MTATTSPNTAFHPSRVGAPPIQIPEGYPPTTFDAEEAASIVGSFFDTVREESWDGQFFALQTRDEVRAYFRHNYIPLERAEVVDIPLWLTKRGTLARARTW